MPSLFLTKSAKIKKVFASILDYQFLTFLDFYMPEMNHPLRYVGNILNFSLKVKEKYEDDTK
jgi:hypothetical protein